MSATRMRPASPTWPPAMFAAVTAVAALLTLLGVTPARVVAGVLVAIVGPGVVASSLVTVRALGTGQRHVVGMGLALIGLMAHGAVLSLVAPLVGVDRPLDGPLSVITWLALFGGVAFLARGRRIPVPTAPWPRDPRALIVAVASGAVVPLAAMSSIRLNNGYGSALGVVTLVICVAVAGVILWRPSVEPGVTAFALYCVGLAVLWMTSLRGWSITGHDIQREFYVFRLTEAAGRWSPGLYHDAYNACLSLNVLPAQLVHMTGLSGLVLFKAFYPAVFALTCPIVLWIGRFVRNARAGTAAAVLFISLPPFVNDMAFLARQEVALLMVAVIGLLLVAGEGDVRTRRLLAAAMGIGTVLAHYSTTYVLLGTSIVALAILWLGDRVWGERLREARPPRVLSVLVVAPVAAAALAWAGPATGTSGFLVQTVEATVSGFSGANPFSQRSGDTGYSVIGGRKESPQERLTREYRTSLRTTDPGRARGEFLPRAALPSSVTVADDPNLPRTGAGRALASAGVSPEGLNAFLRDSLSKLYQLALLAGVVAAIVWGRRAIARHVELWAMALAALFIVALQVVLPALSMNYGVMRAFLQGMIFFGPLVVVGVGLLGRWAGRRGAAVATVAVPVVAFASLTGLLPTLTGGYPAQLNLHNQGLYYTAYYTRDTDLDAARRVLPLVEPGSWVQPQMQVDRFALARVLPGTQLGEDAFPARLRTDGVVFLGAQVVNDGVATVAIGGDFLMYRYPRDVLERTHNLIYANGTVEVYD